MKVTIFASEAYFEEEGDSQMSMDDDMQFTEVEEIQNEG